MSGACSGTSSELQARSTTNLPAASLVRASRQRQLVPPTHHLCRPLRLHLRLYLRLCLGSASSASASAPPPSPIPATVTAATTNSTATTATTPQPPPAPQPPPLHHRRRHRRHRCASHGLTRKVGHIPARADPSMPWVAPLTGHGSALESRPEASAFGRGCLGGRFARGGLPFGSRLPQAARRSGGAPGGARHEGRQAAGGGQRRGQTGRHSQLQAAEDLGAALYPLTRPRRAMKPKSASGSFVVAPPVPLLVACRSSSRAPP